MRDKLGRTIAKANLPSKTCIICMRPFTWRKKWERTWDERTTCSTRCLGAARALRSGGGGGGSTAAGADAEGADSSDGSDERRGSVR